MLVTVWYNSSAQSLVHAGTSNSPVAYANVKLLITTLVKLLITAPLYFEEEGVILLA